MSNIDGNEKWQIMVLKDLNSTNISSEEHSVDIISKVDDIVELADSSNASLEEIKTIALDILTQIQHTDLNRQKVERAMNLIIENSSISESELKEAGIQKAPSAMHIDNEDGNAISDSHLEELIANSNK